MPRNLWVGVTCQCPECGNVLILNYGQPPVHMTAYAALQDIEERGWKQAEYDHLIYCPTCVDGEASEDPDEIPLKPAPTQRHRMDEDEGSH